MSDTQEDDLSLTPAELVKFLQWIDEITGPEEILEFIESEPEYVARFINDFKKMKRGEDVRLDISDEENEDRRTRVAETIERIQKRDGRSE